MVKRQNKEMHHPPPVAAASAVLLSTVPYAMERITSRNGDVSSERRGTAWVTEEGVGALAYSGKLMRPSPLPPTVRSVMREVERSLALFDEVRPYDGEGVEGGKGGDEGRQNTPTPTGWYRRERAQKRIGDENGRGDGRCKYIYKYIPDN